MKRTLLFLIFSFFLLNQVSLAGSDLGGEISYRYLNKYLYEVTYKHYRDCQGTPASTTFQLNVAAPGCNTGRTISLNQVSKKLGKPYGAATPVTCPGPSLPLFEIVTYRGLVNFNSSDYHCRNWVLSVNTTGRTEAQNLVANATNATYYTEANLKLDYLQPNSSPVFDTLNSPLMYVNFGTDYNLRMAAKDSEGDSLVYSLVAPLVSQNVPVLYQTYSWGGLPPGYIVNPNPRPPYGNPFNPQFAVLQVPNSQLFSPTLPIFSIKIDWNALPTVPVPNAPVQPLAWAANPYFELNKATGSLKFNSNYYYPNPQNLPAGNRYLVSILVEEYRKINGVARKIGSVRRETLIQVFDHNTNLDPGNAPVYSNQPSNVRTSNLAKPAGFSNAVFTAYPNPFSEELTFNLNLETNAESIQIYNLLGQQVEVISLKTVGVGAQKVTWKNAAKFAAVQYIAQLIFPDKTTQTLKFTKQL